MLISVVEQVTSYIASGKLEVAPVVGRKSRTLLDKLLRLGVLRRAKEPRLEDRVFESTDVVEQLLKSREVCEQLGEGGEVVLIGGKQFRELSNVMLSRPLTFTAEYPCFRSPRQRPLIMGMRVVVVPWMNGIVVLPERLLEN